MGGAVGIALIGAFGYVANQPQTPHAMMGINLITNVGCGALFLLAMIPLSMYRLTEKEYVRIRARLDAKGGISSAAEEGAADSR